MVEPVLQGAGGMYAYDPRCLTALRRIADEHDLLLVADEIATGFGRTGALFASTWADADPDIMCVGKALTGGTMTLAAVLCTGAVADVVTASPQRALMHGPTFMANPLACAVALASVRLLDGRWADQVQAVADGTAVARSPRPGTWPASGTCVCSAPWACIELDRPVDVVAVTRVALRHGVWVRPFRSLVYAMPPYVCTPEQVEQDRDGDDGGRGGGARVTDDGRGTVARAARRVGDPGRHPGRRARCPRGASRSAGSPTGPAGNVSSRRPATSSPGTRSTTVGRCSTSAVAGERRVSRWSRPRPR